MPAATLKQYEGAYEIHPGFQVAVTAKDTVLIATPTGQSAKILQAEKEDLFFEKEDDIEVKFTRDANNEVDGFILYQGGQQIPCKKIK